MNVLITGKRITDRTVVEELRTTVSGSLLVEQYPIAVAKGLITGAEPFNSYGEKTTIGADSGILWPNGAYSFPPSAGVQMSIVSTSANDTSAGTGIRTVAIHYLDSSLVPQIETLTLNGLTPVNTVATNIRFIQCIHGITFGSGKAAAGNISASNGGNTYGYITTGQKRCASSVRMVPAGKRLIISSFYAGSISGTAAAGTVIRLVSSTYGGYNFIDQNIMFPIASATFQDTSAGLSVDTPISLTEGQAFGMEFTTDKAATIAGQWFGWLENA